MAGVGPAVAATRTATTDTTTSTTTIVTTTVPMVSVYTPPASCSSRWTYEASTYNGITSGILLQNAFSVDTDCFPPGFQQNGRILASQVFSPGACPDRYSTQQFVVSNAVTTATCCLRCVSAIGPLFFYPLTITSVTFLYTPLPDMLDALVLSPGPPAWLREQAGLYSAQGTTPRAPVSRGHLPCGGCPS
jgi:hypothetical protein